METTRVSKPELRKVNPTTSVLLSSFKRWVYILACALIFIWVFQTNFVLVGSHGHSHDDHDGHGHAHDHHEENPAFKYSKQANEQPKQPVHAETPPTGGKVHGHQEVPVERNPNLWFDAIASTLFISAAPFFILFLIPLDNSKEKQTFLKVLLSFASGGLLGDAFLHLIPHAIIAKGDGHGHSHSHSHSHSHDDEENEDGHTDDFHGHDLSVGIWVLVGIITFLMVEKLIRIIKGKGHVHSHSVTPSNVVSDESEQESKTSKDKKDGSSKSKAKGGKSEKGSKPAKTVAKKESGEIQVAGYLNLAADFTHNFTDGLAIGASYLAGRSVGLVTTFTILLHEVPHEIGDFAILIQSGCSKRKAIALQLITALGAVSGTIISLLAEGAGESATTWILPFTAGGFIYIATVSVIPELLHDSKFKQSVLEIFALLAGVYMMVLIAKYE